jgi:hypothetical protein
MNINAVLLRVVAQIHQHHGHARQLRAQLVVERCKLRDDERNQEDQQPDHHDDEQRRIDEARRKLLAEGQRDALEVDEPLQHLFEVARAFAGQQRRRIHHRKPALRLECRRDRLARLHPLRHILQLPTEVQHLLPPRQQVQRPQNGQASLNESQKLLVEDQERVELYLLAPTLARQQPLRLHRVDVISGLRKSRTQLVGRRCRMRLLLHPSPFIRQPHYKFSHRKASPSILDAACGA